MATKKTSRSRSTTKVAAAAQSAAYHWLDALLHTMRCIAQYENALCELSHEAKSTGALSLEASNELRAILDKIPAMDYVTDLDLVRSILPEPARAKRLGKSSPSGAASKKATVTKKRASGRKPSK